jgi:CshA-type fibril repeat protein
MNSEALPGETVSIDILDNDKTTSSPLDPMSVSLVVPANATDIVTDNEGDIVGFTVPGEGEWSVDEDTGAVTFVPDEDLTGYPTPVEYTVKEESGEESNRARIEIVYEEESSPTPAPTNSGIPVATDNLNIPVNSYNPIVIDVLANGDSFGAYGAGTVEISFTQPAHGHVSLDDGGTPNDPTDDVIIYTPKADVNNVLDNFTYTITDAQGQTSTAKVSVNVQCTSSQSSDGGDALGTLSMLLMMFMTLLSGLYFVRKEEEQGGL